MRFAPKNPKWPNRDRFVLSNGHACALQYSMLHMTGYDLPMSELENFRKLNSKAPGHPENFVTGGVEVCTGPLGQGLSNAVGMALARAHMAARFNRPGFPLFDSSAFVICGDGCLMEGITSEACSLAGELGLSGLLCAYDDNNITIDGSTDLAFTEDVGQRFESYGWDVATVEDGDQDLNSILSLLDRGRKLQKPALVKVKTTIGYGSSKANTAHVHGTPLSADDLKQMRKDCGFPDQAFHVPKKVGEFYRSRGAAGDESMAEWGKLLEKYGKAHAAEHTELTRRLDGYMPTTWWRCLDGCTKGPVTEGDAVLVALLAELPELVGGSVAEAPPLAPAPQEITADGQRGQHVSFGSGREHAAAACCVGMAAFGALAPYWRCPLALLPNAWGAIRLSALGQFRVIHVATHDGSDAREVLALCRATPNLALARPADAAEVAGAYAAALGARKRPSVIVLPPPGSARLAGSSVEGATRGGYTVSGFPEGVPQRATVVASGAEVAHAVAAQSVLVGRGLGVQVVSLMSWELFDEQPEAYQHSVLGRAGGTKDAAQNKPEPQLPVFFTEESAAAPMGIERFGAAHCVTASSSDALAGRVSDLLQESGAQPAN